MSPLAWAPFTSASRGVAAVVLSRRSPRLGVAPNTDSGAMLDGAGPVQIAGSVLADSALGAAVLCAVERALGTRCVGSPLLPRRPLHSTGHLDELRFEPSDLAHRSADERPAAPRAHGRVVLNVDPRRGVTSGRRATAPHVRPPSQGSMRVREGSRVARRCRRRSVRATR
jgi:hypothetical protein